jgi:hypothetical protein
MAVLVFSSIYAFFRLAAFFAEFKHGRYLRPYRTALILLLLISALMQMPLHMGRYSRANDYSSDIFSRIILEKIPYDSVVFTGSFSTFSNLSYLVFTTAYRDDLSIAYAGLILNRDYVKKLGSRYEEFKSWDIDGLDSLSSYNLQRIYSLNEDIFVELSIDRSGGKYSIRYPEDTLRDLYPHSWFFKYSPEKGKGDLSAYRELFQEVITPMYLSGNVELKKQIMLGIFLHSKHALFAENRDLADFLLGLGLSVNSGFEEFKTLRKENNFNK